MPDPRKSTDVPNAYRYAGSLPAVCIGVGILTLVCGVLGAAVSGIGDGPAFILIGSSILGCILWCVIGRVVRFLADIRYLLALNFDWVAAQEKNGAAKPTPTPRAT